MTLHSTYEGLHYSESITEGKLKKLKKQLEGDIMPVYVSRHLVLNMDAREALKIYFGYESYKPGQEEIIGSILAGRDVLAVMPTGCGEKVTNYHNRLDYVI